EADLTPSDCLRVEGTSTDSSRESQATAPPAVEAAARSFEQTTGTVAAGYANIESDLSASEIDTASFEFRVRAAYLDELGASPAAVTLYRQTAGEWEAQETTYLQQNGSFHEYESKMPGFSVFAIGTGADVLHLDADLSLTGAGAGDNTITLGEDVTVSATVENRGQATANETFRLTADGTSQPRLSALLVAALKPSS
ncbi:MAG: PGF-pre-PGF domain-containing protein, partial [Halobacteriaceae archaeon]